MKRSPPRSGRGQSACGELKQKNILRCCHCCLSKKMSLISVLILIFILILYIESVQNNKVMALDRIHSNLARTITEVDECCQSLLIIFSFHDNSYKISLTRLTARGRRAWQPESCSPSSPPSSSEHHLDIEM